MKLAAPTALVLLAATAFAAAAAGRDAAGPTATRCGGELWRLKTLSDPGRKAVQLEPTSTTIAAIGKRPFPRPVPKLRRTAFQRHTWEVVAQITKYRVDGDGIRLELYDHESSFPRPTVSRTRRARARTSPLRSTFSPPNAARLPGTGNRWARSSTFAASVSGVSVGRCEARPGTAPSYIP